MANRGGRHLSYGRCGVLGLQRVHGQVLATGNRAPGSATHGASIGAEFIINRRFIDDASDCLGVPGCIKPGRSL